MNTARTRSQGRTSWIAALVMTALLQACGGGGGGGDPAQPSAQPSGVDTSLATLSIDTAQVDGSALEGNNSAALTVAASGSQLVGKPVYAQVDVTGEGLDPRVSLTVTDSQVYVNLHSVVGLAPGRYTGTATVRLCADAACTRLYPGSPRAVPYAVQVQPLVSSPVSSLSMATAESGQAVAALSLLPANSDLAMVAEVDDGGAGWLSVEEVSSGVFRLHAVAGALHTGFYQGTVKVRTADGLQNLSVPVSLIVNTGMLVSPAHATTLNASTVEADTQAEVHVGASPGVNFNWTATSATPWIKVDTPSGAAGAMVRWHLDLSAVEALANQTTHEGVIQLQADQTSISPVSVRVMLHKRLPEIDAVAPFAVPAGRATTVRVRGRGFNAIADLSAVRVGNVVPTSVQRLSDTALLVALPALSVGEHGVLLHKLSALTAPGRALKVFAPTTYSYAAVSTADILGATYRPPSWPTPLLYDPVRRTVTFQYADDRQAYYVYNAQTHLVQFRWSGRQWVRRTQATPNVLLGLGVTADGDSIIAAAMGSTNYNGRIHVYSVDTLAEVDQYLIDVPVDTGENGLAITNDNHLLILYDRYPIQRWPLSYVDLQTRTTGSYNWARDTQVNTDLDYLVSAAGVSGDGEHVLVAAKTDASPLSLDASEGKLHSYGLNTLPSYSQPQLNRDGSRVWSGFQLWDGAGKLLGSLDISALFTNWKIMGEYASLDTLRLYVLTYPASVVGEVDEPPLAADGPTAQIQVYDLSKTDDAGHFVRIGQFPIAHYPSCRIVNFQRNLNCVITRITAAPDDRALFLVGSRYFVTTPVPALP